MQPEEHEQPEQRSYWIASAPHEGEHPALDGDLIVDVALLEADRVAAGVATAGTAGHLMRPTPRRGPAGPGPAGPRPVVGLVGQDRRPTNDTRPADVYGPKA